MARQNRTSWVYPSANMRLRHPPHRVHSRSASVLRLGAPGYCLFCLLWVSVGPAVAQAKNPVKISGVLFDGIMKGTPEPESAVRLTNTNQKKRARIGGYFLSDEKTPNARKKQNQGLQPDSMVAGGMQNGRNGKPFQAKKFRRVFLPSGAAIPAGGEIWLAHKGDAFVETFGFPPDYEAVDTRPDIPNLIAESGWLIMPAKHGTVTLFDPMESVVDFVAYDRHKTPRYAASQLAGPYWQGPAVPLHKSSAYGWTHQILSRDRDEKGRLLADTNRAADWDSGNSAKQLGIEPTHRVELPGQTQFRTQRLRAVKAKVWATSAPDNNYQVFVEALRGAKREIRISVYQLTNPKIAAVLLEKLQAGVRVKLWLEGAPVGGIPDQERHLLDMLAKAGAEVHFLISDAKQRIRARYRFDHSKYTIIDRRRVIIGTENYGRTGVPPHPSYGNRGWMIHIEEPDFVKQIEDVWEADYRPGKLRDVRSIDDDDRDAYGLPYRDPNFRPDDTIQRGWYPKPVAPLFVNERMDLELVLSPDTSLNERTSIIGMIQNARSVLYIQQNSVRRRWGRKHDTRDKTPDLPLEAVILAARRGVKVRVMLDGTWYNVQGDDDRDNDDTARMLNELAVKEGLDLSAKVINLESTHLEKIHAKGVIADHNEVFVGSINWSENSFKGNREVGVIVRNPKVASYYASLFERDWAESRMYEAGIVEAASLHRSPSAKSPVVGRLRPDERVWVVGEHGSGAGGGPGWLELRTSFGHTAFVEAARTGVPTASPLEALHLLGREAIVEGRVARTRVSPKVIQLRFADEKRPPFTAVIFRSAESRFLEAGIQASQAFQGRKVRVRGRVQQYKSPEIILSRPDQIEWVK